jgi:hypothetical protein
MASLEVRAEVAPRQAAILMSFVLDTRLRSVLVAWMDEMVVHGRLSVASTTMLLPLA